MRTPLRAEIQRPRVVEHVFAHQKGPMGLIVRTIGIARDRVTIGMANLAYNIRRFVWLRTKYAAA
jgi:transposase, IS5 family